MSVGVNENEMFSARDDVAADDDESTTIETPGLDARTLPLESATTGVEPPPAVIDSLTVAALAVIAMSTEVAFHEGMHALFCRIVGGNVLVWSALVVECQTQDDAQSKVVAGSAAVVNVIVGVGLALLLRFGDASRCVAVVLADQRAKFLIWLALSMHWFSGTGYWLFSGIGDVGDWAIVILDWNPVASRIVMTIVGLVSFVLCVIVSVQLFAGMVGGTQLREQMRRGFRLMLITYVTSVCVMLVTCVSFWQLGPLQGASFASLPVVGGLLAVLGAFSPFLYMMFWFHNARFAKPPGPMLEIRRSWWWIAAAIVITPLYAIGLASGIRF
jgi:hypothetical protein